MEQPIIFPKIVFSKDAKPIKLEPKQIVYGFKVK